ncbi:MAG: molybdenum cofactor biosynthesis protein [Planctomycetota bacterium]|nr:MAG: molybdenum cofactor biosynthesis protein [Planctomycetota bacterium]
MLSVDEALKIVLAHATPLPPVRVALGDALGCVLAEEVASDVDSPPHDKAMVDGYAVVAADLASGRATLRLLEVITAGEVPRLIVEPGTTTRIMTGAPIPAGADAVVMVERSSIAPDGRIALDEARTVAGQNIFRRGRSLVRGQVVLRPGARLRSIEVGALAEVGRGEVQVVRRPSVAVLATGNELVAPSAMPDPGQIRNSNGPMLVAAVREAGATPVDLGIARDDVDDLARLIEAGLAHDVLLLSGGVSAGVLDLVPAVLKSLAVDEVFHKVNLKPGKPLWFGHKVAGTLPTLVFGLPGNPVGSLVCFELFVRPVIAKLSGRCDIAALRVSATLTKPVAQRGDRPTYFPAAYCETNAYRRVEPLPWQGSADLATLVQANSLLVLPPGDKTYAEGEPVEVHLLGN